MPSAVKTPFIAIVIHKTAISYDMYVTRCSFVCDNWGIFAWTQILDAMNQDSGIPLTQLQVDGGMTSNRLLMQLQADILCIPVGKISICFVSC